MQAWLKLRAALRKRRQRRNERIVAKEPIFLPTLTENLRNKYLSAVAIVKNEANYLEEWLQFHLMMGIEHFYIYENGSTDHILSVLLPYEQAGLVTVVPWRAFSASANTQSLAYAHAVGNFGSASRWMAFFDIDEFMFPTSAASLVELLQQREEADAICVAGVNFGTDGHTARPTGLVTENYRLSVPMDIQQKHGALLNVKSIVQPDRVKSIESAHWFNLKDAAGIGFNADGEPMVRFPRQEPLKLKTDVIRYNHYYTRSHEEFSAKVNGSNARGPKLLADAEHRWELFRKIEALGVPDDTIQRYLPELKARLSAWQKQAA